MERLYYDYAAFRRDLKELADRIDEPFDTIVAIARGGLTMAHMLGEYRGLRRVFSVNSVGYDETTKRERVEVFNLPDLQGARSVLVVDDIADTGETLKEVLRALQERYPGVRFRTATLFYKPERSCVEPDWWLKEAKAWIDFFWSEDLASSPDAH